MKREKNVLWTKQIITNYSLYTIQLTNSLYTIRKKTNKQIFWSKIVI